MGDCGNTLTSAGVPNGRENPRFEPRDVSVDESQACQSQQKGKETASREHPVEVFDVFGGDTVFGQVASDAAKRHGE